jgi:hypothetical protein
MKLHDMTEEEKNIHRTNQLRKSRYNYYQNKKMLIIDIEKLNDTIKKQDVKINELELDIDNYKLLYNELLQKMK